MSSAEALTPSAERRERPLLAGLARLLLLGGVLLAAALAPIVALALLVPEANDYAMASRLKHQRLDAIAGRKVVLVGGSNLPFGIDSTLIEAITRCPTVNMGMNGYFGVRLMLEEVRPQLRSGDVVVISLEPDSFYKDAEGTPSNLFAVVKANPKLWDRLTWMQRLRVAEVMPFVAQQKAIRLARERLALLRDVTPFMPRRRAPQTASIDINQIEALGGFTATGDLVSHLNRTWPDELEDGDNLKQAKLHPDIIPLLAGFARDMRARDVAVIYSYGPVHQDYFRRYAAEFAHLDAELRSASPLTVTGSPERYAFAPHLFFDTVYHLDAEGREIRTRRLVEDLQAALGPSAQCAPTQL